MTFRYHDNVVRSLGEMSDRDTQERLWLASEGEFSSFVEAVEELFSDTGLSDDLDRHRAAYGEPVDSMFLELRRELHKVDSRNHPGDIIESPQMERIRKLAGDILAIIR